MVSEYKNTACKYRLDRLDDIVYLISEDDLKDINIDNGEAYIENMDIVPLSFKCYNLSLEDTSSFDERYAFTHTVKFSIQGYANYKDFDGKYYVIVRSKDENYWLLNPFFPCKVTFTYTLGYQESHTDFTLATISNFPTLRIHNMSQARQYECEEYILDGIEKLFLNEKKYSVKNGNTVNYSNDGFKEIVYNKQSAVLSEIFDGDSVSHSIEFSIAFDDYKDSWHYNLLEFADNLYSAIIVTKKGDYVLCGFSNGLQPSFTVNSDSTTTPNHIEIRLLDIYDSGDFLSYIEDAPIPLTGTSFSFTLAYDAFECVGANQAKYLLKEEYDAFNNPLHRYKCLVGYESQFDFLGDALVGTFDEIVTFYTFKCQDGRCQLSTSLTSEINMKPQQCMLFSLKADTDWTITTDDNYLTFTPSSGEANTQYTVELCNFRIPNSNSVVSSTFSVNYCSTSSTYTVNVGSMDNCLYNGTQYEINANAQTLVIGVNCLVDSVTESSGTLTNIQVTNNTINVYVPQNSAESSRTFTLRVAFTNNTGAYLTITQGRMYSRWVSDGYVCDGANKCELERMYSGTSASATNTYTDVTRTVNCVASDECRSVTTRWVETSETVCDNGFEYYVEKEQQLDSSDVWQDTGYERLGAETEDSPSECADITYEYSWTASDKTYCGENFTKYQMFKKQQRVYNPRRPTLWFDAVPTVYSYDGEGTLTPIVIETSSVDCGFDPSYQPIYSWGDVPIYEGYICDVCPKPMLRAKYSDGSELLLECYYEGSSITTAETKDNSYDYSAMTSAVIGECVTSIGEDAFDGCSNLNGITIYAPSAPTLGRYALRDTNNCPILIPIEARDSYVNESTWQPYASRIHLIPSIEDDSTTCKFTKQRKYVSYDDGYTYQPTDEYREGSLYERNSSDCGYYTMYRWRTLPNEYICDGCSKYQKQQKYISTNMGSSFEPVIPSEYRKGSLIEEISTDCCP